MPHYRSHAVNDTSNHSPGTNNTLLGTESSAVAEKAFGTAATAGLIVQRNGVGDVVVPPTPTTDDAAASKEYVDDQISGRAKRTYVIQIFADDTDVTTGDGKGHWIVPDDLDGCQILKVEAGTIVAGSGGGPMLIQIHNLRLGADVLSTRINVEASELHSKDAATQPVINTANDDLQTGDRLRFDVDAVCTTAHKGLFIVLEISVPLGSLATELNSITTVTGSGTISYATTLVNNSSDVTETLPPLSASIGKKYTIKKVSANNNTVTIDGDGAEQIRVGSVTANSHVLYIVGDFLTLQANDAGTLWECVDDGLIPHQASIYDTTGQVFTSGVNTKAVFGSTLYDNAGLVDLANDRIVIKRAGKYKVETHIFLTGSPAADKVHNLFIYKNGTSQGRCSLFVSIASDFFMNFSKTVDISATEYIEMNVSQGNGTNKSAGTSIEGRPTLTLTEIRQ